MTLRIADFIALAASSPLAPWCDQPPWLLTTGAAEIVLRLLAASGDDFRFDGDIAIHRTATIESGTLMKGPAIIGAHCFVAAGTYLRGGIWLDERCVVGPGSEVKSSFVFRGTRVAHLNFVGDTILGAEVNLEAGSIVANARNERRDKQIRVRIGAALQSTGVEKFGALIGDGVRIGANAVIAPGSLIRPGEVVPRLSLVDQDDMP
jgi:NDP-sugar pyrophosphorylase family protein